MGAWVAGGLAREGTLFAPHRHAAIKKVARRRRKGAVRHGWKIGDGIDPRDR